MPMRFDPVYASHTEYFGSQPSHEVVELVARQDIPRGLVLDLGCGQGRNAIFLAQVGFSVVALDVSAVALDQLSQVAIDRGLDIRCVQQDILDFQFPSGTFGLVVAATVLDHLPSAHVPRVAREVLRSLVGGGFGYISVFTTNDPGFEKTARKKHCETGKNASECSDAIAHYFQPGELRELFADTEILEYEERRTLDTKHGLPHFHGRARMVFQKPVSVDRTSQLIGGM